MGTLESILQQVKGELGGGTDQQHGLASSLITQLSSGGGLSGLVQSFTASGLGQQVMSWVGTEANQPVNAQQIQQALGSDRIRQLAAEHGIDPQQVGAQLARILPVIVDKLTPNGQLPGGSLLDELKGMVGGTRPTKG